MTQRMLAIGTSNRVMVWFVCLLLPLWLCHSLLTGLPPPRPCSLHLICTIKGFGIVNKVEIYIFLELSCFFNDRVNVGNLISSSSAFSKTSLNIWKFTVHVLLKRLPLSDSITAQHCNTCNVWTQTLGLKDEVLGGVGSLPGSAVCVPVFEESILEWGSMQWPCLEV